MRRVIIGDIHGHDTWRRIRDAEPDADEFMFLGDYMDAFGVTRQDQEDNFRHILEWHDRDPRVILLAGNHDMHYTKDFGEKYSGWNAVTYSDISALMTERFLNHHILSAYVDEIHRIIYSHAGVTSLWLGDGDILNVPMVQPERLRFTYRAGDCYGSSPWSGPIWVRPSALKTYPAVDREGNAWEQVVGHTPGGHIRHMKTDLKSDLWVCDALPQEYLVQELDGKGGHKSVVRELGHQ